MPEQSYRLSSYLPLPQRRALQTLYQGYEVTLISCVLWKNHAPWSVPWRTCPDTFFLIPTKGEVFVTLKKASFTVRPGEMLMLPDAAPHALRLDPNFQNLEQFAVHCHIHDHWKNPLLESFDSYKGLINPLPFWINQLKELTCLATTAGHLAQMRGSAIIRELLAAQITKSRLTLHSTDEGGDRRIQTALQILEKNFSNAQLSVERIASHIHITPVQFRKLFRRETKRSPKQFLSELRLREAGKLLSQSNSAIKTIAANCGFASDQYFHSAFRSHFGCTPTEYRRRAWQEL